VALVSVEGCDQDQEQKLSQPGEDEAEVVASGGEDGVGGVAVAAVEMAAAEVTVGLHVTDHGSDGAAASELALDGTEDARFCPEMKMRRGLGVSWPRYPLST
jgi:hypothetical protein